MIERAELVPRSRPLLAIEQICARGDEAGVLHLSLHFRPSRLKELLDLLVGVSGFGSGQVALELARGTGFLKLDESQVGALRKFRQALEEIGGAVALHAGAAAAREIIPPFVQSEGARRVAAALKQELDPRELLHRGRLG